MKLRTRIIGGVVGAIAITLAIVWQPGHQKPTPMPPDNAKPSVTHTNQPASVPNPATTNR